MNKQVWVGGPHGDLPEADLIEEEESKTYWWSEKPHATTVLTALIIFPIILTYWGFALVTKKSLITRKNLQWVKKLGRPMNEVEKILYQMELDRKFGI